MMGSPKQAKCEICGKAFLQYRKTQKYCSNKCRKKGILNFHERKKSKIVEKECAQCHKKFTTNLSHKKFCSHECYTEYKSKYYKPVTSEERICPQCGNSFSTTSFIQKYCSHKCYLEAKAQRGSNA